MTPRAARFRRKTETEMHAVCGGGGVEWFRTLFEAHIGCRRDARGWWYRSLYEAQGGRVGMRGGDQVGLVERNEPLGMSETKRT